MSGGPDGAGRLGPPPGVMNLTVVNLSATIDDAAFERVVAAIRVQVNADFQPVWGLGAVIATQRMDPAGGTLDADARTQGIIYVGDRVRDPDGGLSGMFGYHNASHGGTPYAFVYLDVCVLKNEPWTCTLSHEVLELLADPTTAFTAPGPAPEGSGLEGDVPFGLEVCDPTQQDHYAIEGVLVTNFVTRAYFGDGPPGAPTNFLELDLAPFAARPGGYIQYDDGAMMQPINGSPLDEATLQARLLMAEHRRNARREAVLRPVDSALPGLAAQGGAG